MDELSTVLKATTAKRLWPSATTSPDYGSSSAQTSNAVKRTIGDPDCSACGGLGHLRIDVPFGHPDFGELFACDCRQEEITAARMAKIESLRDLSSQLPTEKRISLTDIVLQGKGTIAMKQACDAFLAGEYGFLTLWGGSGNGKSLALHALVNAFVSRRQTSVYFVLSELIEYLRRGYDPDAGLQAGRRWDTLMDIDLLAVDEFDPFETLDTQIKVRLTSFAAEVISNLIDVRHRQAMQAPDARKYTALSMNGDPGTLSPPIYSRLRWGADPNAGRPDGFRIVKNADADMRPMG